MRITDELIFQTIFGSKLKRRIWRFLAFEPESISERELSRILGVSHTAVNKAMKDFKDLNLVSSLSIGGAHVWKPNKDTLLYDLVDTVLPLLTVTTREMLITRTHSLFSKNKLPGVMEAFIIGSVARRTAKLTSDIDILVLTNSETDSIALEPELHKKIGVPLSAMLGNGVSFHLYAKKAVDKNKPSWLKDAISTGIKVCG